LTHFAAYLDLDFSGALRQWVNGRMVFLDALAI